MQDVFPTNPEDDPRRTAQQFDMASFTAADMEDDTDAPPRAHRAQPTHPPEQGAQRNDPDVGACALDVVGLPPDFPLPTVQRRFCDIGALRCAPTRREDGSVRVTFCAKDARAAALGWFRGGVARIGAVDARVSAVQSSGGLSEEVKKLLEVVPVVVGKEKRDVAMLDEGVLGEEFVKEAREEDTVEPDLLVPKVDGDVEACALRVFEFPKDGKMKAVERKFDEFGRLRAAPVWDGDVIVVAFCERDVAVSAFKWFRSGLGRIAGHDVRIELVRKEAE